MALWGSERIAVDVGAAFPAAVRPEVAAAASIMPSSPLKPTAPLTARVDGEMVLIPYRIYNDEPAPPSRLSPDGSPTSGRPSAPRDSSSCTNKHS